MRAVDAWVSRARCASIWPGQYDHAGAAMPDEGVEARADAVGRRSAGGARAHRGERAVPAFRAAAGVPPLRGRVHAEGRSRAHQGLHHRGRGVRARSRFQPAIRSDRARRGGAAAPRDRGTIMAARAATIRSRSWCRAAAMCRASAIAAARVRTPRQAPRWPRRLHTPGRYAVAAATLCSSCSPPRPAARC